MDPTNTERLTPVLTPESGLFGGNRYGREDNNKTVVNKDGWEAEWTASLLG